MREQIELCFFVGYEGPMQAAFKAACIDTATRLCGGCFVVDGTGYWREGKNRRAHEFDGELVEESTFCLKLTTELYKERTVMAAMRAEIAAAANHCGLEGVVRWIHVQRHVITGLHFSIENMPSKAA